MTKRIGVFGGTFDPPHIGHLVTAVNVRYSAGLDEVLLVVANEPWQKVGSRRITPAPVRLEMVRAAVAGVEGVSACDIELHRGGPSYTVETLADLAERNPGAELVLVLGADAAAGLDTWERAEELPALASILVVDRPGSTTPVDRRWGATHLEVPRLEVSSTELRRRVATGAPLDFLVPPGVCSLIERHGLYRGDDARVGA